MRAVYIFYNHTKELSKQFIYYTVGDKYLQHNNVP